MTSMEARMNSLFTFSQWKELEHQALIFKYLVAGLPVPPDLLLPIQKSFQSLSSSFFHHPTLGCYPVYGKKVDSEPGRCRRTDGKKWRCSKEAYPDSKYCERHMHRGRNRSRKPVESQTISQPSLSTMTSLGSNSGVGTVSSHNQLPLPAMVNPQGLSHQSQFHMDSIPYAIPHKDYRYLHGLRPEVVEHGFVAEASGSSRGLQMDTPVDHEWRLQSSQVSFLPSSKAREVYSEGLSSRFIFQQ